MLTWRPAYMRAHSPRKLTNIGSKVREKPRLAANVRLRQIHTWDRPCITHTCLATVGPCSSTWVYWGYAISYKALVGRAMTPLRTGSFRFRPTYDPTLTRQTEFLLTPLEATSGVPWFAINHFWNECCVFVDPWIIGDERPCEVNTKVLHCMFVKRLG